MTNIIRFEVNDEPYSIDSMTKDVHGDTRLVDFIRNVVNLKGTKIMCREGGCGACVITVKTKNPLTGLYATRSMNSCLIPVLACHGWKIYTIESLGNSAKGYHPIQKQMKKYSATQCGFCSPGFVMSMYGLTKSKQEGLTCKEIEDNFDGNMCRCTGYRPILDAMKTFGVDSDEKCVDIEEVCTGCPLKNESKCSNSCSTDICSSKLEVGLQGGQGQVWVKVMDLHSAFQALDKLEASGKRKIRIVAGNSGAGVFKNDGPYDGFVDVKEIAVLSETKIEENANANGKIIVGTGNTLAFTIDFFRSTCSKLSGFEYTEGISKHIKRIANAPVRNIATLAGNLMLKHDHPNFPSDIFLLFETIGAKINIVSSPIKIESYSLIDFLSLDMRGKLIVSLEIPQRVGWTFRSFKITKRSENAHAYVNAGFFLRIDPKQNFKILEKPSIVFGGINPNSYHIDEVENILNGSELGDVNTLKAVMKSLDETIKPDFIPPDAKPTYRKNLTKNLFYKVILGILGSKIKASHLSGAEDLPRLLTSGQQTFTSDNKSDDSPLYKPILKLEAAQQLSGEAEYVDDIPIVPGELFGALVLATLGNCKLVSIDASEALNQSGVVKFIQASDIPGQNHTLGLTLPWADGHEIEPIFVVDKVSHAGQALGLVLAQSRDAAYNGAKLVKVNYTQIEKPIVTIDQAIEKAKKDGNYEKLFKPVIKSVDGPPANSPLHKVKGEFNVGSQAHVQMETHITICHPTEGGEGLNVYSATQWPDLTQSTIAAALNVPCSAINVQVRRLGGGFGSKISRATHVAAVCGLASFLTRKPVRVALTFEENMALIGKRFPHKIQYEVGFNDEGQIKMLKVDAFCDTGAFQNEETSFDTLATIQNCYRATGWELRRALMRTNTPSNTWTRAPGHVKGIATGELIMEHISHYLKRDPMEIRRVNLIQEEDSIVIPCPYSIFKGPNLVPELWDEMEKSGDFKKRQTSVEEFNQKNRWRKRGIAMCPMRYPQQYGARYGAYIAIYRADGTVAVSHGGIEMGQGINTKVAQVVAHELGIELEKIRIQPSNSLIGANNTTTGAARTSELCSYAALMAAKELNARIDQVRKTKMNWTWSELIGACHVANVNLTASYLYTAKDLPKEYNIWGLNCVEVEIDCLTGEFKIPRSDLIADVGTSLSPAVDLGQVEGAYVMGLGLWTKERLVYCENTGQLLTNNTWEYKVPFVKCIPEDFRVSFVGNRPNPLGVLGSKASGEAPICLSVTILLAIRNAIAAARQEIGHSEWFTFDSPVTPEKIVELCLTDSSQFSF